MAANDVSAMFGSFAPDDPEVVAQQQQDNYNALYSRTDAAGRRNLGIQQGINQAFGNPLVKRAADIQSQFKSILSDVNDNTPDDEDPLDTSLRQNEAIARGMIGTSPQMAMQAAQNAVKLREAKSQQALLGEQTEALKQRNTAGKLGQQTASVVLAKMGKDDNGIPSLDAVATLDPNDPDFANKLIQARADAAKNGDQVIPMTGDQFINGKGQLATVRANAAVQQAQIRAAAMTQAALIRAQQSGQRLSGNESMMANRILSSANEASQSLENVANLPMGASSGWFAPNRAAATLTEMLGNNMRQKLSDQDVQSYNLMMSGVGRNLAMLEMQGGIQGGHDFAENLERSLKINPGDTAATAMQKMAEARQIIDKTTELYRKNEKIPPAVRETVQEALDRLGSAIPYTVNDVTKFLAAQQRNPKMTFREYAQKQGLGLPQFNNEAEAEAALQSGKIMPGSAVMIAGKRAIAQAAQ